MKCTQIKHKHPTNRESNDQILKIEPHRIKSIQLQFHESNFSKNLVGTHTNNKGCCGSELKGACMLLCNILNSRATKMEKESTMVGDGENDDKEKKEKKTYR